MSRVRVQLTYRNGQRHFHDAERARLDGDEIVIEMADDTLRVPTSRIEEWAVRRTHDPVAVDQRAAR
jgi:hypothetical protein